MTDPHRRIGLLLAPPGTKRRGLLLLIAHGVEVIRHQGWRTFWNRVRQQGRWSPGMWKVTLGGLGYSIDEQYQQWLERNRAEGWRPTGPLTYEPTISIVMPTFNTEPAVLRAAIDSVLSQSYTKWELCIVDDGSDRDDTVATLRDFAGEARIKLALLPTNVGIAEASNRALSSATGDFVGFLDHDDELKPQALREVCRFLSDAPDTDYLYTDEDHRDPSGRLVKPFFKPGWAPELLTSMNYCGHFSVIRRSLLTELGGLRPGFDGSQDHDLILRASEVTERIGHVAQPLYTWRMTPSSQSGNVRAKPYAQEAAVRALADAMSRRHEEGEVETIDLGRYRVRYSFSQSTRVSIIIPTRDAAHLLERCIESIRKRTSYQAYEVVVVDNGSMDPETVDLLDRLPDAVISLPGPFNFSRLMNHAAASVEGDALVLLNNDTEIISPEWLEALLEQGLRAKVGAVGARLLYPSGRPQHEGIVLGLRNGLPGNVDHRGYFRLGDVVGNRSAVSAACMLTRRSVFDELGGLDEELPVAFNDVDYCLRAANAGYRTVYTPFALLYHHEGSSRGTLHPPEDEALFRRRWGSTPDPFYNPNLSKHHAFSLDV